MTKIASTAGRFAAEALEGFADVYAGHVRLVDGGVVRRSPGADGKVAVVIGGGSGHYPAFLGYVGTGIADAAVAGDVFASPSTRQIVDVARLASRGGGVLLGFGNYAGDVLNFGAAAEQLNENGVDTRILAVTDDVASAPPEQESKRRGIAGDVVVFKVAGAAADAGETLDAVVEVASRCNARTRTLGVAFAGCTLPGAGAPLFEVAAGQMGVGLGIHGEPGIEETALVDADALAELMVARLLAEAPPSHDGRVAAILNGLGATKYEELFVLWRAVARRLRGEGLDLVQPEVGEYVTSLDMSGCSLTLTWLDDELAQWWTAPADTPAFRRGVVPAAGPITAVEVAAETVATTAFPPATAESATCAARIAQMLHAVRRALAAAEPELGRLDSVAGDGDHGSGMVRGATAAVEAAEEAVAARAGVASTLRAAADAWADRAGGTSGALWGVLLRKWSEAYTDDAAATEQATLDGAADALRAVMSTGGAQVGDKTIVDAFAPFAVALADAIGAGKPLAVGWREAAQASHDAAMRTADLRPRLGRARPLAGRSLGHADPGAVSFALCVSEVAAVLES